MIKLKHLFGFFPVLFLAVPSLAQDLPGGEVDVVKTFEARLMDTERILMNPELPPLDTATRRQLYNIISKNLNVDYLPPKIRPIAMRGDALQKGYNGYARLGAGIPASFYGEGSYNLIEEKKYDFGLSLFHHSADNNRNIENQKFSLTDVGLKGTYYFDQGFAVNGRLGYNSDVVHFFGYNDLAEELSTDFSFDASDVKQQFTTVSIGANIFNGERTIADFNYSAGFDAYFLEDDYAVRETGFDLNINGTKWFDDTHPLSITLKTDFTSYRDTAKQSLDNFYLQPNFTFHSEFFLAKIGANIVSHDDEFSFFPDLELSAQIVESILGAFVGANGTLQKNTFKTLSDYNPYISSRTKVENTRYYNFYGGIKGNIEGMDYRAQVNYKNADNLALFLINGDTIPRFNVLYDTVDIFSISGTLTAPLFKGFEVTGTVSQNVYSTKNQEKPWHLPSLSVNVGAKYVTMEGKLLVKGELFIENGVPFINSQNEADNLNALFDISLGAEYYFAEQFGTFITINNLANNHRQRWHRYPVFGLNALVGISARF